MPPLSIENAVKAAEREIARLTEDYPAHLRSIFSEMEGAAKDSQWERVRVMAHDLKGQAATLGQPVIGEIARSLQTSLETPARDLFRESVYLHLASLRYCLHNYICLANPEASRLDGADLSRANLSEARLNESSAVGAKMNKAEMTHADLSDSNLTEADLAGANLTGANLSGARMTGARLDQVNLSEVNIDESVETKQIAELPEDIRTLLHEHDLWIESNGQRGRRGDFRGRDLSDVNLERLNFNGANLSRTNFSGAILAYCQFLLADLSEANLSHANLYMADLMGANLRGANLYRSSLRYANLGPATIWRPGASETGRMWSVNLEKANLSFADLSEANLKEANMSGADLTDADIEEINVSGSVIKDTVTDSSLAQSSSDISKGSASSRRRDD
jgi:uncharacterized protein YjbI with pentapeptide repeats